MLFISIQRFFQRKQTLSFRFLIQSINLFLLFVLKYASSEIMILKEQNAFNLLQKKIQCNMFLTLITGDT